MKRSLHLLAIVAFGSAMAVPALAQDAMDASKMSCKDYSAMDADGMMKATTDLKTAAKDNSMADPKKMEMSDEDVMKMIQSSCEGKPDMMAMDAMHSDM